ncbi:hypothetical protein BsWGS_27223 [Bradybaena similaris]
MNYAKKIALFRPPSRSIESESVLSFDDLEDDDKDSVKRKTRNLSEKKRRDQFNVLINELCSMVAANTKKMDKSTVLKSAIQFLKNHQDFLVQSAANEIKEDWKPTFLCSEEFAQLMLEAVESFLVVFTQQGKVLFVSDSVTSLLGHLPSDLINHSLYDILHEDDHLKLFNLLSKFQPQGLHDDGSISFTGHLRRGSMDPSESATYEYVKVFGTPQMVEMEDQDCDHDDFIGVDGPKQSLCFCCTVRLQTSHIIREMSIIDETTCEFTSRHSLEWKFLFLDHRAPPIIGYLPFEVLGTSGYDYYHPDDLEIVSKCHEQLIMMGKGRSNCYRFLTKGQQWIWLQTRYFVTYHQWNSKPEFIVCTNTVVGYGYVRRQLRQDMGYVEGDAVNTAVNSTTNSGSASNECLADTAAASNEGRPQQEGHVTSLSQSESLSGLGGKIVQSPDIASSQHSDSERTQQPHSTKQESNTRRHVSSQLQSLLQLHLQRSLAASSASSLQAAHTTSTATTAASTEPLRLTITSTASQARVACSSHSTLMSVGQQMTRNQVRVLPSLVPLMTAMSTSLGPVSTNQRLLSSGHSNMNCHSTAIISSPLTSPAICGDPHSTSGLVLNPAQQLLHEQLVHKSEQLQCAIQRQQEELRFIKEQLAYTHGTCQQMVSQQQHSQQQQSWSQQQQKQPQIQQQHQHQQQHQYVLQQQLGLGSQSMLLTPVSTSAQFAMMSSNPNHIFLSPITEVRMDPQAQQQHQQQHMQCQQNQQQHMQCQQNQQQLVLQHDTGRSAQTMMLAPTSPGSQLTLIRSSPNQIFLSPTSMDLLPSPQQSQQQRQHQEQSLHFLGMSHSSSEPHSNME